MKGYQHFLFSLALALSFLWPPSVEGVGLALLFALGALLPDLDAEHSAAKDGRLRGLPSPLRALLRALALLAFPLAVVFGERHRGCFHSLYAALALFLWLYFVATLFSMPVVYAIAVVLGFVAHIVEDAATPAGVRPLCSFRVRGRLKGLRSFLHDIAIGGAFILLLLQQPKEALFLLLLGYGVGWV